MTKDCAKVKGQNAVIAEANMEAVEDRGFDIAKRLMPYQFGSLWWGRDDLIEQKQKHFYRREDRIGHPLVSVSRDEIRSRNDAVPMLVGTSGEKLRDKIKQRCVKVVGMTAEGPDKISFFGSTSEPCMLGFEDLLDGVVKKANSFRKPKKPSKGETITATERVPWYELRVTYPNTHKPQVNDSERQALEAFCHTFKL